MPKQMLRPQNFEPGRVVRAVNQLVIYETDEHGDDLPDNSYMVVTRGKGSIHYTQTEPELSCDCRDWIMKGVEEEGYDTGVVCKHLICSLLHEGNDLSKSELNRLRRFD